MCGKSYRTKTIRDQKVNGDNSENTDIKYFYIRFSLVILLFFFLFVCPLLLLLLFVYCFLKKFVIFTVGMWCLRIVEIFFIFFFSNLGFYFLICDYIYVHNEGNTDYEYHLHFYNIY